MDKIAVCEKIVRDANDKLAVVAGDEFEIKIIKNNRLSDMLTLKIDTLQKIICQEFDVPVESIASKDRHQNIVNARFAFCLLATEILNLTRFAVGRHINRHYSTVVVAIREIKNHMEFEGDLRNHIYYIKKRYYENYSETKAGRIARGVRNAGIVHQ